MVFFHPSITHLNLFPVSSYPFSTLSFRSQIPRLEGEELDRDRREEVER